MDKHLARAYISRMGHILDVLELSSSPRERLEIAGELLKLTGPLYIVDSEAAQHIEEAVRKLKYPEQAIVNAALLTIERSLRQFLTSIETHPQLQFVTTGPDRIFAKPVAELELRSLAEKERLFDQDHSPFVHAIEAPPHVERVLLEADAQTLRPALQRLGFPHADAILFFKTSSSPALGLPARNMPSLTLCKIRSGSPLRVVGHRVLR